MFRTLQPIHYKSRKSFQFCFLFFQMRKKKTGWEKYEYSTCNQVINSQILHHIHCILCMYTNIQANPTKQNKGIYNGKIITQWYFRKETILDLYSDKIHRSQPQYTLKEAVPEAPAARGTRPQKEEIDNGSYHKGGCCTRSQDWKECSTQHSDFVGFFVLVRQEGHAKLTFHGIHSYSNTNLITISAIVVMHFCTLHHHIYCILYIFRDGCIFFKYLELHLMCFIYLIFVVFYKTL